MTAKRSWEAARRRAASAARQELAAERPKRSRYGIVALALTSFLAGVAWALFVVWVVLP